MKVFFIPNYFYLNIQLFEKIINKLKGKGVISYILKLPGHTNISADNHFDHIYLNHHKLNLIEPQIYRVSNYRKGIFPKIKFLYLSFFNLKEIRRQIKIWNPNIVVAGSDLGNLNVRFLIDTCLFFKIPIIILYMCDLPQFKFRKFPLFSFLCRNRYVLRSKILSYLRALLFKGSTPGEYSKDSIICVISNDIRKKLILRGIDENRIVVTGMPFSIYPTCNFPEDVLKKLSIPEGFRLVVIFTECIQNIYGKKYAKALYRKIAETIEKLPNKLIFLIKLHPLENEEMITFFNEVFSMPHCKIIINFDVEKLIGVADLCIAHFSRTLITAALMGKRFLSINLMKDRKRTFIRAEETDLEIQTEENLLDKIMRTLNDSTWQQYIDAIILKIANRFLLQSKKNSILKIESTILSHSKKL